MKLMSPSKALLEAHYADLSAKPFFPGMIATMMSGPVCCMVWEGFEAVAGGRRLLGATKPSESAPGTIRGDFALMVGRNICHGSDSVENAKKEIALWFKPEELTVSTHPAQGWVSAEGAGLCAREDGGAVGKCGKLNTHAPPSPILADLRVNLLRY